GVIIAARQRLLGQLQYRLVLLLVQLGLVLRLDAGFLLGQQLPLQFLLGGLALGVGDRRGLGDHRLVQKRLDLVGLLEPPRRLEAADGGPVLGAGHLLFALIDQAGVLRVIQRFLGLAFGGRFDFALRAFGIQLGADLRQLLL